MNTKISLISILAIIISFFGGFLLANALNSSEISKLQSEKATLEKAQKPADNNQSESNLTNEEIQSKIKEADDNPKDFAFQKGLGLGLYRYAALKQDRKLLEQVTKLLERAYQLNSKDYLVIVSLGNIYYDLGQLNKDSESNLKAREYYKLALDKNDKDSNVLTDHGLTYLLTDTPERQIAIKEFEKALSIDPKNEKALVYISQALAEEKKIEEAKQYLARIKEINPKNERIPDLEGMISQ